MHRRGLVVAVALVAALVLSSCDWGQPRFGASRTGANPGETVLGPGNVAKLRKLWSVPVDAADSRVEVLKVGRRVFVANNGNDPTHHSTVMALDARTGATLWSRRYEGNDVVPLGPNVMITTAGDALIVARSFGTSLGELTALDMATGAQRWTMPEDRPFLHPVVHGDRVYAGYAEVLGTQATGFVAVDVGSGKPLFRSQEPLIEAPSVAVAGSYAYVSKGAELEVYDAAGTSGCDAQTGICVPLWTATLGDPAFVNAAMPAISGGVAYVGGSDGKLRAYPATGCGGPTCQPVWTGDAGGPIPQSPAVAGGAVHVLTRDGTLATFPAAGCGAPACAPAWTAPAPGPTTAAPAVANGVVYTTAGDQTVRAYAAGGCGAATCPALWQAPLGAPTGGSPIVTGGRVYVGATGSVTAFALPA